jgi:hypothetical protein
VLNTWPSRCGALSRRKEKDEPPLSGSECLVEGKERYISYKINISSHAIMLFRDFIDSSGHVRN